MNETILTDIFKKSSIIDRAKDDWNYKDERSKKKCGHKYNHIFINNQDLLFDWTNPFDKLSLKQQHILIKGEVIRTYDSLPNIDKTIIKKQLELSEFCTKWYKLSSEDKNKLLRYVL